MSLDSLFEKAMASAKRYSVRCGFCKARWMEDVVGQYDDSSFGKNHFCPRLDAIRTQAGETARWKRGQGDRRSLNELIANEVSAYVRFKIEPVKWKRTSDPTECGPRCMGATGSSCDCRCQGKNHGSSKVLA